MKETEKAFELSRCLGVLKLSRIQWIGGVRGMECCIEVCNFVVQCSQFFKIINAINKVIMKVVRTAYKYRNARYFWLSLEGIFFIVTFFRYAMHSENFKTNSVA